MTLEEALAQSQAEEVTKECIIDPVTRTITIPDSEKLFGVESDERAKRIFFRCPKIVGNGIDLSELMLFVNYRNANKELGMYYITDVESNGDEITFSWELRRKVTAFKGAVQFIVCAKKGAEQVENEWNTTLASGNVLEGLEVEQDIEEENADVIMDILLRLKQIEENGGAGGTTNYENLSNLPTLNGKEIKGAMKTEDFGIKNGDPGPPGEDGKSAYEYAQEGGFTGTEQEFINKLTTEYWTKEEHKTEADISVELEPNISYIFPDYGRIKYYPSHTGKNRHRKPIPFYFREWRKSDSV